MAPRQTRKESAAKRKQTLKIKTAEKQRQVVAERVRLATEGMQDANPVISNDDYDGSIESSKRSGESAGSSKRKQPPSNDEGSTKSDRPSNKIMSSKKSKSSMQEAGNQTAKHDTDDSTCTEKEDSDEDDDYQKPSPALTTPKRDNLGEKEEELEETAQSPAEVRAVLIETEERLFRAERQGRAISKTRIADTFLEGQVRTWTKETLWKMCKFITNDKTMHQVMQKASKHFKVPAKEQEHWMSSYAHIVRDGLNQKRNACSQDLRKTIKSKWHGLHRICR
jgi:hypothetical protein